MSAPASAVGLEQSTGDQPAGLNTIALHIAGDPFDLFPNGLNTIFSHAALVLIDEFTVEPAAKVLRIRDHVLENFPGVTGARYVHK